jgi:demethylmenaquinone methyltransferase/2-methoxy-6-polyprenyl-1,4-benzoquinol methylase
MVIEKSRETIGGMFDRVAPFYDFLNRALSLYLDVLWRKKAVAALSIQNEDVILDIATGTGDLALEALKKNPACRVVGLDFAREMMRIAAKKRNGMSLQNRYYLVQGDALQMPFKDHSFDKAMVAFGIRNVPDVNSLFRETRRILKDSGKLAILELSVPQLPVVRPVYLFYFKKILPWIGRLASGKSLAYHYLRDSVIDFYTPSQVECLLRCAGFTVSKSLPLTFGICHLYLAECPSPFCVSDRGSARS